MHIHSSDPLEPSFSTTHLKRLSYGLITMIGYGSRGPYRFKWNDCSRGTDEWTCTSCAYTLRLHLRQWHRRWRTIRHQHQAPIVQRRHEWIGLRRDGPFDGIKERFNLSPTWEMKDAPSSHHWHERKLWRTHAQLWRIVEESDRLASWQRGMSMNLYKQTELNLDS